MRVAPQRAHLVELERIEQVIELAVLLALLKPDKVLLETVERELLLVIDVDLERLWRAKDHAVSMMAESV